MSKSEEYTSAQLVSKEYAIGCGKDFVKYIADSIIRELSEKVLDRAKFSDVIVSLKPMRITEHPAWNQVEYRRNITVADLVRCEECKHSVKQQIGYGCKMNYRLGMNGKFFCAEGERKDDDE